MAYFASWVCTVLFLTGVAAALEGAGKPNPALRILFWPHWPGSGLEARGTTRRRPEGGIFGVSGARGSTVSARPDWTGDRFWRPSVVRGTHEAGAACGIGPSACEIMSFPFGCVSASRLWPSIQVDALPLTSPKTTPAPVERLLVRPRTVSLATNNWVGGSVLTERRFSENIVEAVFGLAA